MLLEASQKDGRERFSFSDLFSLLPSSESDVSELLLDNVDASECLWLLPASEGETGTCTGLVSPCDAGGCCGCFGVLLRERIRPRDARRE